LEYICDARTHELHSYVVLRFTKKITPLQNNSEHNPVAELPIA